jgi:Zn-dependent protease with chaperone function
VGRWVYVGEQIAGHIIAKRDALDRTLEFISHIDLRVAWIGWIMRTIVWSIRSLMETAFRWVVIAHRALSREMEFHADLVAVSATGSDALINALYRLQSADEDWERGLSFANLQLGKCRTITDLFAVQTRIGEHMLPRNRPSAGCSQSRSPNRRGCGRRILPTPNAK